MFGDIGSDCAVMEEDGGGGGGLCGRNAGRSISSSGVVVGVGVGVAVADISRK